MKTEKINKKVFKYALEFQNDFKLGPYIGRLDKMATARRRNFLIKNFTQITIKGQII